MPSDPGTERRPATRLVLPALAAGALLVVAAAAGAAVTGAAAAPPLGDPGPLVRWALPPVAALEDLAATVALGALVLAWAVLPLDERRRPRGPVLVVVCAAAAGWALAGLARLVLGYAAATGQGLGQPDLGTQLASYVTQVGSGRAGAVAVALAAVVATVAAGARSRTAAAALTVPALAAVAAGALAVHEGHRDVLGVAALTLHVAGVAVWIGGLATLALLAPALGPVLAPAASRWAGPAVWAFLAVAASGVLTAWQPLGGVAGLATGYGAVVLAKTAALVAVGVLGALHRRRVLPTLGDGRRDATVRAVAVELALALLAIGMSGALAASDAPAGDALGGHPSMAASARH